MATASRAAPSRGCTSEALRTGDPAAVLKAAQAGLETTEHAAFVGDLEHRRTEQGGETSGN